MKLLPVIGCGIAGLVAVIALFDWLFRVTARRHARFTKSDVIASLRNVLDLDESPSHDEWDLFLAWPIDDPELDQVRQRCLDINERGGRRKQGRDLTNAGEEEVRRILAELESTAD